MTESTTPESDRLRTMAMRWLHRTDRSRRHVEQRLLERGGHPNDIAALLDEFTERGWIDDRRCAEALRARWCRTAPMAPEAIAARLEAEGIETDLAREVAWEGNAAPIELAMQLAKERLPRLAALPPETQARRLLSLLGRRGFEEDVALEAIERLSILPK